MSWISKTQVLATLDINHELKRRLFPKINSIMTCYSRCTSDSDCSDCWVCCSCTYDIVDNIYMCKIRV